MGPKRSQQRLGTNWHDTVLRFLCQCWLLPRAGRHELRRHFNLCARHTSHALQRSCSQMVWTGARNLIWEKNAQWQSDDRCLLQFRNYTKVKLVPKQCLRWKLLCSSPFHKPIIACLSHSTVLKQCSVPSYLVLKLARSLWTPNFPSNFCKATSV